jgi:tRNA_anti-like
MKKWKKILLALIIVGIVVAGGVYYYVFVKDNHRSIAKEKGIEVTATQLVADYKASDSLSNIKYLDKAIQVTGIVTESKPNQDSLITVTLQSGDVMSTVMCTLKKGETTPTPNTTITIKGLCTGYLSDVILTDAIIINKSISTANDYANYTWQNNKQPKAEN